MPQIYSADRPVINALFALHVLIAGIVSLIGPLQFVPAIRNRTPGLHRLMGRVYVFAALLIGLDGLGLIWRKDSGKDLFQAVVISLNALIIIGCAWLVWRNAVKRKIADHNRWAVHLLLAMSGVWFFRVFLMLWLVVNGGPAGFDPYTFSGPALNVLSIVTYLLPQLIAVWYFRVKISDGMFYRQVFGYSVFLVSAAMSIGLLAAVKGLWLRVIFSS
ncbi:hypothetical protein FPE01S_05_01400 [Flavihumibacter petaseus NBRC 106054]|uniref:DUF2306 domain-containing protein n=1 Tax=Flavihumibacter petaseus NBRC 106054 TaxID=1220578 RepID=A0A0E9N7V5_9BACT|nr:hypothetical protein FPE01S_05_01400 [Flavihumibacter petaseus NBRC 106054]